jgi:hypothetical protein
MRILPYIFVVIACVLYIATATLLVRKYLRTHDIGFVWLGAAVLVWPLLARLLEYGQQVLIDRLIVRVGAGPLYSIGRLVATLKLSQQIVGLALLFVAVFYLGKTQTKPDMRAA